MRSKPRGAVDPTWTGVIPDPEKVRFWEARASAYDRLCRRWEIFSLLSNRLIDLLPASLQGPVLDIGAGAGLTSELLLARHPRCQAILIEPSEAMLNIARANLAGRPARFFAMGLDRAAEHDLQAVAGMASICFPSIATNTPRRSASAWISKRWSRTGL